MTAAQPNPIDALTADTVQEPEPAAERDAGGGPDAAGGPEYVGDMPDDPERARTYRPDDPKSDGEAG